MMDGVFVMIDGLSAFATLEEAERWMSNARKLPQTAEVKREIKRAEEIISSIKSKQPNGGSR